MILKVKTLYQFDILGKGNLVANTKSLGSQNLQGSKAGGALLYNGSNKYVLKVQLHSKSYTSCIMLTRTYVPLVYFWSTFVLCAFWGRLGAVFTQILNL